MTSWYATKIARQGKASHHLVTPLQSHLGAIP